VTPGALPPRVAVVGGGVLGVSTAAHLVRRGAAVTVLTQGRLADGASGRSLSWLNSWGQRSEAYHRLRLAGLERYRALAASVDCSPWLRFDGGLTWAAPGEEDGHRDAVAHMHGVGYRAEWLTRDAVAARVPGVDPAAVPEHGAVLNADEGWVDLGHLVDHLVGGLVAGGGTVVTDAGPCEVVVAGDRVAGVRTASGSTTPADAVVLATGAAVPATAARLGTSIPDATTNALLVRTAPVASGLRAVLNTPRVAVRPAPGGTLVLDSGWAEDEVTRAADGSFQVRDSTVQGLLREASAVLAGHPRPALASFEAGRKPIPGDGEPVIGGLPGVAGLHVAFTHSGATLGLVVGDLLADEVLGGSPSPLLAAFRPSRFG
jgi:glycine/D-amino acid oxidase-like deaminating enzyme